MKAFIKKGVIGYNWKNSITIEEPLIYSFDFQIFNSEHIQDEQKLIFEKAEPRIEICSYPQWPQWIVYWFQLAVSWVKLDAKLRF